MPQQTTDNIDTPGSGAGKPAPSPLPWAAAAFAAASWVTGFNAFVYPLLGFVLFGAVFVLVVIRFFISTAGYKAAPTPESLAKQRRAAAWLLAVVLGIIGMGQGQARLFRNIRMTMQPVVDAADACFAAKGDLGALAPAYIAVMPSCPVPPRRETFYWPKKSDKGPLPYLMAREDGYTIRCALFKFMDYGYDSKKKLWHTRPS